jgi:hypothetical protein
MQVVLSKKVVAATAFGLFNQPLVNEKPDDVPRSNRRPAGKRGIGDEGLLIIRREVEATRLRDGD